MWIFADVRGSLLKICKKTAYLKKIEDFMRILCRFFGVLPTSSGPPRLLRPLVWLKFAVAALLMVHGFRDTWFFPGTKNWVTWGLKKTEPHPLNLSFRVPSNQTPCDSIVVIDSHRFKILTQLVQSVEPCFLIWSQCSYWRGVMTRSKSDPPLITTTIKPCKVQGKGFYFLTRLKNLSLYKAAQLLQLQPTCWLP